MTKEVTFNAKGKVVGDTFTGAATATTNLTDFGIDPPDIANFIKAGNGVRLELMIETQRAP